MAIPSSLTIASETYKGNFAAEISKGGIDGLIKTLSEKNKRLAASAGKAVKTAS